MDKLLPWEVELGIFEKCLNVHHMRMVCSRWSDIYDEVRRRHVERVTREPLEAMMGLLRGFETRERGFDVFECIGKKRVLEFYILITKGGAGRPTGDDGAGDRAYAYCWRDDMVMRVLYAILKRGLFLSESGAWVAVRLEKRATRHVRLVGHYGKVVVAITNHACFRCLSMCNGTSVVGLKAECRANLEAVVAIFANAIGYESENKTGQPLLC